MSTLINARFQEFLPEGVLQFLTGRRHSPDPGAPTTLVFADIRYLDQHRGLPSNVAIVVCAEANLPAYWFLIVKLNGRNVFCLPEGEPTRQFRGLANGLPPGIVLPSRLDIILPAALQNEIGQLYQHPVVDLSENDIAVDPPLLEAASLRFREFFPDAALTFLVGRRLTARQGSRSTLVFTDLRVFKTRDGKPANYAAFLCPAGGCASKWFLVVDRGGWLYSTKSGRPEAAFGRLDPLWPGAPRFTSHLTKHMPPAFQAEAVAVAAARQNAALLPGDEPPGTGQFLSLADAITLRPLAPATVFSTASKLASLGGPPLVACNICRRPTSPKQCQRYTGPAEVHPHLAGLSVFDEATRLFRRFDQLPPATAVAVCFPCYEAVKKQRTAKFSAANGMGWDEPGPATKGLTYLGKVAVSPLPPFMTMQRLQRNGQIAVKGLQVTLVPRTVFRPSAHLGAGGVYTGFTLPTDELQGVEQAIEELKLSHPHMPAAFSLLPNAIQTIDREPEVPSLGSSSSSSSSSSDSHASGSSPSQAGSDPANLRHQSPASDDTVEDYLTEMLGNERTWPPEWYPADALVPWEPPVPYSDEPSVWSHGSTFFQACLDLEQLKDSPKDNSSLLDDPGEPVTVIVDNLSGADPSGGVVPADLLEAQLVRGAVPEIASILHGASKITFQDIVRIPGLLEVMMPCLFPKGRGGPVPTNLRAVAITPETYFATRVCQVSSPFASSPEFLMLAFVTLLKRRLIEAVSMRVDNNTVRALLPAADNDLENLDPNQQPLTAGTLKEATSGAFTGNNWFTRFGGETITFGIPGTPSYFNQRFRSLNAIFAARGMPHVFLTMNPCTHRRLTEFYDLVCPERDLATMTAREAREIAYNHPAVHLLCQLRRYITVFEKLCTKDDTPFRDPQTGAGLEVSHLFWVLEHQNRGAVHVHSLVWFSPESTNGRSLSPADPNFEPNLKWFYEAAGITTNPNDMASDDLRSLCVSAQAHCHGQVCHRPSKKRKCRFGYPRPPIDSAGLLPGSDPFLDSHAHSPARLPTNQNINPFHPEILAMTSGNMDISLCTQPRSAATYLFNYILKYNAFVDDLLVRAATDALRNTSLNEVKSAMNSLLIKALSSRNVGSHEAALFVSGIDPVFASDETVYVKTSFTSTDYRVLKPAVLLQQLPDDSAEVFQESILDVYRGRPPVVEHLSQAEFRTLYRRAGASRHVVNDNDSPPEGRPFPKAFKTGHRSVFVLRDRPAVLSTTRVDPQSDPDAFFLAVLVLFIPFRLPPAEAFPLASRRADFLRHLPRIRQSSTRYSTSEGVALASVVCRLVERLDGLVTVDLDQYTDAEFADLVDAPQADETQALVNEMALVFRAVVNPSPLPSGYRLHRPSSTATTFLVSTNLAEDHVADDDLPPPFPLDTVDTTLTDLRDSLNPGQRSFFNLARSYLQAGKPKAVLLSGAAGVGKSRVIEAIAACCVALFRDEGAFLCMAASAVAAGLLPGGTTIHSAFGATVGPSGNLRFRQTTAALRLKFSRIRLVVVDEVSMLNVKVYADIVDALAKLPLAGAADDAPYGGRLLVFAGDYGQLPSVKIPSVFTSSAFLASTAHHLLTQNMRQNDDANFASVLNRLRHGTCTPADTDLFRTRCVSSPNLLPPHAVYISSKNSTIEEATTLWLRRHFIAESTDSRLVFAFVSSAVSMVGRAGRRTVPESAREANRLELEGVLNEAIGPDHQLSSLSLADKSISVKDVIAQSPLVYTSANIQGVPLVAHLQPSMRVRVLTNMFIPGGIVNGATATVVSISSKHLKLKHNLPWPSLIRKKPEYSVPCPRLPRYVSLRFDNPAAFSPYAADNRSGGVIRLRPLHVTTQKGLTCIGFPLGPAVASTVHKSQGQTLPAVAWVPDLTKAGSRSHEVAAPYVIASRVRRFQDLFILSTPDYLQPQWFTRPPPFAAVVASLPPFLPPRLAVTDFATFCSLSFFH